MLTREEIEKKLSGLTAKTRILELIDSPGQMMNEWEVNDILDYDLQTATVLEQMVTDGICVAPTNRWWPSQRKQLSEILSSEEFLTTAKSVVRIQTVPYICLQDEKTGNTVIKRIESASAEAIRSAVKMAKKEMSDRRKATIARVNAEKIINAE